MDVQRGLFDAEGVFPAAAIAFAGTSDTAAAFRPSAFRSRGSWTFATVPPATLPQDDLALLRSMFLAPVVFEMCCRHDSTQICGANRILRLSRQSICHLQPKSFQKLRRMAAVGQKAWNPNGTPAPRHISQLSLLQLAGNATPSPASSTHLRKCVSPPLRVPPYFTRFDACVTPGAGDDSLSRLAYRSYQPQTWESEFTERDEDGFDG